MIHADETVVQVLKEDGKPATSESRMWLYASAALLRHQVTSLTAVENALRASSKALKARW